MMVTWQWTPFAILIFNIIAIFLLRMIGKSLMD